MFDACTVLDIKTTHVRTNETSKKLWFFNLKYLRRWLDLLVGINVNRNTYTSISRPNRSFGNSGWYCRLYYFTIYPTYIVSDYQRSGAAEACWAHNPKVEGSKPSSAISISGSDKPMRNIFVQANKMMKYKIINWNANEAILWFYFPSVAE